MSEVVGQEQVTKPLSSALKSGKISHAYLFIGPRGCGKTSVARIFAHEINNFQYEIEDTYTDIIEIDAASNTGVDNIRELREKACVAPSEGKYKVYIIDEVHMLTKSAFNALLKTLEEPPKHIVFILATTDAYKVPATITSRTQVYNFHLATPDVMRQHLQDIIKKEQIEITDDALNIIIERGGGSFRDTISLLDQISTIKNQKIDQKTIIDILGLPENNIINNLLEAYTQGDTTVIINTLKDVLNTGVKPESIAEDLINAIIKDPKPYYLSLLEKLPEVTYPFPEAKLLLAFLHQTAEQPHFSANRKNLSVAASNTKNPTDPPKNSTIPKNTNSSFSWDNYLSAIAEKSVIVSNSLKKAKYLLKNQTLYLYFVRSYDQKIISHENNLKILKTCLPGNLEIEITEDQSLFKNSATTPQISDIMGNVQEVNLDGNPFK